MHAPRQRRKGISGWASVGLGALLALLGLVVIRLDNGSSARGIPLGLLMLGIGFALIIGGAVALIRHRRVD